MRTIIVHTRTATINADPNDATPVLAHCFGPFESEVEAVMFDSLEQDDCFKVLLPIIGPADEDVDAALAHEQEHEHEQQGPIQ